MNEDTVRELVRNEMSYGDIDSVLDALCPPGTLRVIDRRPRPCPECNGTGNHFYESEDCFCDCISCGGAGTVDTPTLKQLERMRLYPFESKTELMDHMIGFVTKDAPPRERPPEIPHEYAYRLMVAVGDTEGQAS